MKRWLKGQGLLRNYVNSQGLRITSPTPLLVVRAHSLGTTELVNCCDCVILVCSSFLDFERTSAALHLLAPVAHVTTVCAVGSNTVK
jgi:hypothetical protein